MPKLSDLPEPDPLNNPRDAQIMLGDNPHMRENMRETVAAARQRVEEDPTPERQAMLAEVERTRAAYAADPVWAGATLQALFDALEPLVDDLRRPT